MAKSDLRRVSSAETGIRTFVVPGLSSSPLSSSVEHGGFVFASGQVGREPDTGVVDSDFEAQARQAIKNLATALEMAGASLATVVRTTVYLARRADFEQMNRVYAAAFESPPPARSTIVVELARPDLLFEIDAIAVAAGSDD